MKQERFILEKINYYSTLIIAITLRATPDQAYSRKQRYQQDDFLYSAVEYVYFVPLHQLQLEWHIFEKSRNGQFLSISLTSIVSILCFSLMEVVILLK